MGIADLINKAKEEFTEDTSNEKTIRIECEGATTVDIDELNDLQCDFKDISDKDYKKLKTSILENGFSFPAFLWKDQTGKLWIVDAHRRKRALKRMRV